MKNGPYELVKAPDNYPGKKYRGKYCYEHHLVYWKHYGILPGLNEVIHHKNERKRDNRIENLELVTHKTHNKLHKYRGDTTIVCTECGEKFIKSLSYVEIRSRAGIPLFCGRVCAGKRNKRIQLDR